MLNRLRSLLTPSPRAATQPAGGGTLVTTPEELEAVMRGEATAASGAVVTADTAMRVPVLNACVRIRSGAVATLPLEIKRRVDDRTREDATEDPLWALLRRRPNAWQTPSQFKRMLEMHVLLRGNGYALKGTSGRRIVSLQPLHPDRMRVEQDDDGRLRYEYTRRRGDRATFRQDEIFHLVGASLDGVTGVSAVRFARETIGLSLAMEQHGARTFRNGARPSGFFRHPSKMSPEAFERLKASIEAFRAGNERAGGDMVLEEGLEYERLSLTAEDAQWIESRRFSRTDIAMFFGVPPHMVGDTEKSTSWGTGIEAQTTGFVTFTLEDSLTMWEETIGRDLIPPGSDLYARFNRKALVRGDLKTRTQHYVSMLQWGVYSPNEVRALEDENPREDGDVFYDPPNTAGTSGATDPNPEDRDEPERSAASAAG